MDTAIRHKFTILLFMMVYSLAAFSQKHTENKLGILKQINAGVLNVGYAEAGPDKGPVILLLHGWPYDIHSFEKVVPILVENGYRVITPYLRGYGSTTFLSEKTTRNGQQAALATDVIALMDALKIKKAIIAGFDWGARTADIVAAIWPERVTALVSVSGYLIGSQQNNKAPLQPKDELSWWYQFYFATERGADGYAANTREFAKLIWKSASPDWNFDENTFNTSAAAFENPDHVAIVIDNYRWRLGLSKGERQYDEIEMKLATAPVITVPAVTIEGDANGAPHPDPSKYASKFKGKYVHLTFSGGVGHNPPAEAPEKFAAAVMQAYQLSKN